jgi:hypothetical protein
MDEPPLTAPPVSSARDDGPVAVVPSRLHRATARPSLPGLFRAGWAAAAIRALIAVCAAVTLAEGMVVIASVAGRSTATAAVLARTGGVLFLAFNHVGVVLRPPASPGGLAQFGLIGGLDVTLSLTPMLGTALAGWLLWVGGRAVGNRAGGPAWLRGLHGMKVAVPYAAACFGLSFVLAFSVAVAGRAALGIGSSFVSVQPSRLGAFLWPLVIGVVAGFSGGLSSRAGREAGEEAASPLDQRLAAAVSGGWRMLLWGLALSFAGLLMMGAFQPHLTRVYVSGMFGGGGLRGAGLTGLNVLVVPNMATWVLFPSMGSCVGGSASFSASVGSGSVSQCLLSYRAFGLRGAGLDGVRRAAISGGSAAHPPAWAFLFVLVPLVAVLAGGRWAARRAAVSTRIRGGLEGAAAGLAFGALATGIALLSDVVVRVQATGTAGAGAPGTGGQLRLGPYVLSGGAIALAWGVLGGALGGYLVRPGPGRHDVRPPDAAAGPVPSGSREEQAPGLPPGPPDAPGL